MNDAPMRGLGLLRVTTLACLLSNVRTLVA